MKCVLSLLFLLFLSNNNYSQIIDNYGLKLGFSYSNIDEQYSDAQLNGETYFKWGLCVAVFTETSLFKNINLISEIGYIQKGYEEDFTKADAFGEKTGTFTYKERFDYLTIKLLPSYKFELSSFTPYVFIGPKLDFKLNIQSEQNNLFKVLNNEQFGLSYGAGVKLNKLLRYPILVEINSDYDFGYCFSNEFLKVRNISYELRIWSRVVKK